jgi:hypothetical protein
MRGRAQDRDGKNLRYFARAAFNAFFNRQR